MASPANKTRGETDEMTPRGNQLRARIHETAIIEDGVTFGDGTSVWDNVHIRQGTSIGEQCIIGEKSYIAYDVKIANRVKINAFVYICFGVTIEDGVMISAGTVFTNDQFPRATTPDLASLRSSQPDEETRETIVRAGATIGATLHDWQRLGDRSLCHDRHGLGRDQIRRRFSPRARQSGQTRRLRVPVWKIAGQV